ncbi:Uncharacterised protein [Yersinia mollaretii]|nr:Uncharacterised protein [Yersinia mollaretii]CQH17013.1 Uncharacterised protein [Yersinia mollaretii]
MFAYWFHIRSDMDALVNHISDMLFLFSGITKAVITVLTNVLSNQLVGP